MFVRVLRSAIFVPIHEAQPNHYWCIVVENMRNAPQLLDPQNQLSPEEKTRLVIFDSARETTRKKYPVECAALKEAMVSMACPAAHPEEKSRLVDLICVVEKVVQQQNDAWSSCYHVLENVMEVLTHLQEYPSRLIPLGVGLTNNPMVRLILLNKLLRFILYIILISNNH